MNLHVYATSRHHLAACYSCFLWDNIEVSHVWAHILATCLARPSSRAHLAALLWHVPIYTCCNIARPALRFGTVQDHLWLRGPMPDGTGKKLVPLREGLLRRSPIEPNLKPSSVGNGRYT